MYHAYFCMLQVSEVDPNLLKFTSLEELTLSCNFISELNSRNLPQTLKVSLKAFFSTVQIFTKSHTRELFLSNLLHFICCKICGGVLVFFPK